MKKSLPINLIFGAIMLTTLLSAFGIGNKEEMPKMCQRQIDISGNIFKFMMPEDFSRDMPAEDLIEQLDLKNSPDLKNEGFITLMRRWWDLKESGLFGKKQGTVMMSISVRNRPQNLEEVITKEQYDFHQLHHFILAMRDSLVQRHKEHNEEVAASNDYEFIHEFSVHIPDLATNVGSDRHSGYDVVLQNDTHWIHTETIQGRQSSSIYSIPITEKHFLEIEFTLMPNDNIAPYTYLGIARAFIHPILETFTIQYAAGNEFDEVTKIQWKDKTFIGELDAHGIKLFPEENTPPELEGF